MFFKMRNHRVTLTTLTLWLFTSSRQCQGFLPPAYDRCSQVVLVPRRTRSSLAQSKSDAPLSWNPTLNNPRRDDCKSRFFMSSEVDDEFRPNKDRLPRSTTQKSPPDVMDEHDDDDETSVQQQSSSPLLNWIFSITESWSISGKMPPIQVDDHNLLYYDVFLLINLTVSISFWVVHRLQFDFIWSAFSEGCLLSLLWIGAGLFSGAFLHSAVDGHYGSGDERGGPKAAGLLGFQTYINTVNLRLLVAFVMAVLEHRAVGSSPSDQLLPLEVGFGMVLMSAWRTIHSSFVPRL